MSREWLQEARANIARIFVDALHLGYEAPADLVEGETPTVCTYLITFQQYYLSRNHLFTLLQSKAISPFTSGPEQR